MYERTWREVKEALRRAMLEKGTATAIARKAGIRVGAQDTGGGGASVTLLATLDPARGTVAEGYIGSYADTIPLIYSNVLHNSGYTTNALLYNCSFRVPATGLYRIDATAGIWRDTFSNYNGAATLSTNAYNTDGTLYRSGFMSDERLMASTALSLDDAVVIGGTWIQEAKVGMQIAIQVAGETDPIYYAFGDPPDVVNPVNIYSRIDPSRTRLTVEQVKTFTDPWFY